MLLNIKCSSVTSVAVHLVFDDNSTKDAIISNGDLIDVEFNQNGLRKRFQGRVINIKAIGPDPKSWSLIVDGSGDFESDQVRFSPMNILDIDIIRKDSAIRYIETTSDCTGIMGLRVVRGRLEYTKDGFSWKPIRIGRHHIIKDEVGTCDCENHPEHIPPSEDYYDEDVISDEN